MSQSVKYVLGFILLAIAFWAVMPYDGAIAKWLRPEPLPGDFMRTIRFSEIFAHGFGVVMILMAVATLDRRGWRPLPRLLTCAFMSGFCANLIKLSVARYRPNTYRLKKIPLEFADSFDVWFPRLNLPTELAGDHTIQSFPSAHSAMAFGLALGLSSLYPRGRFLFFGFAIMASLQRVIDSAHFATDAIVGVGIGLFVGWYFQSPHRWTEKLWRKWEGRDTTTNKPDEFAAIDIIELGSLTSDSNPTRRAG